MKTEATQAEEPGCYLELLLSIVKGREQQAEEQIPAIAPQF
jgi:hypothetical protein